MGYRTLYAFCQTLAPHIHRNAIRDKTAEIVGVAPPKVRKTDLDTDICRGFYLSARNREHPFVQQHGTHVIVLPRQGLTRCAERFVYVKELMHLFDDPLEATDSGAAFEKLLDDLVTPSAEDRTPQMKSEIRCFWMALGVLCPEETRLRFSEEREKRQIDNYAIALKLRIPELYVARLFDKNYLRMIKSLISI